MGVMATLTSEQQVLLDWVAEQCRVPVYEDNVSEALALIHLGLVRVEFGHEGIMEMVASADKSGTYSEPHRAMCSFCGKFRHQVKHLFANPSPINPIYICNECVLSGAEILNRPAPVDHAAIGQRQFETLQKMLNA
jgi:hypothetical protein